jgi:hypothetical protein
MPAQGNRCLTTASLTIGAQLDLGTCNRATAKGQLLWMLLSTGSSAFELFPYPANFSYDTCVAASNASGSNGTRLVMEPCDASNLGRSFSLG